VVKRPKETSPVPNRTGDVVRGRPDSAAGALPCWACPSPLASLSIVAFVSLAAAFAIRPMAISAFRDATGALSTFLFALWLSGFLSPIVALLQAAALAAIGWATLAIASAPPRFSRLFTLFLAGQAILALSGLWIAAVLWARGAAHLTQPADLAVPQGLDIFFSPTSPVLLAIAQTASIVHVAWFLFLVVGLPRATGISRRAALAVGIAAWDSLVAAAAVRALLLT
jgi:hypothetical protein